MSDEEDFGGVPGGSAVRRLTISGGGLTAHILTYGAVLQDLRLEGHRSPLVLGFDRLDHYLAYSPYFGATVGRYANRIAGGRFTLDGRDYQLDLNEKGRQHLHGGSNGIGLRVWDVVAHTDDAVTLTIDCVDGDMGYPGDAHIRTTYRVTGKGTLSIRHETVSDAAAPASISHHSYFNLDGGGTILDHDLMIAAEHYLPVDAELIPTGEIAKVEGTAFDFREMRSIRSTGGAEQIGYDHNFCLGEARTRKRSVAYLRSLHSGISMEVRTGEPGVQFYAGANIAVPVAGLEDRRYGAFSGLCLETQNWPDAPNHPDFPNAILQPGETLVQETDYVFDRS